MITRESQVLINFLNIRVIVNGKDIYTLVPQKPVLMSLEKNNAKLVATDGFHYTKTLELTFPFPQTYRVKVECAIDNNLLITGVVLLVIFALVGLISDLVLLRLLSFVPIFYFLFLFYINRREFIKMTVIKESKFTL